MAQHRSPAIILNASILSNQLYKAHGDMNGKNVANIMFETKNGTVGIIIFGAKTCILASIDTAVVTSDLSPAAIKYIKIYSDEVVLDGISVILQNNQDGKYRIKIKTSSNTNLGVFDVVAVCPSITGLSIITTNEG